MAEQDGAEGQAGNVFEDIGMFDGFGWGLSPCKGGVSGDQDAGHCEWVEAFRFETADDDCAGVADVGLSDLFGGEGLGDGNGAVEVVGVGCAEAGNGAAGLGPGGGELGMGVNDSADLRELAIEKGVGVEVTGWTQRTFDDFSVEAGDDHVSGGKRGVVDAAGLDDDEGFDAGAVDAAGVAEGVWGEAAAGDLLVGAEDLLAKRGEQHGKDSLQFGPGTRE